MGEVMKTRRIVLAGGSGFLGQLLGEHFQSRGWEPVVLTRHASASARFTELSWDARTLGEWQGAIDGSEVVINLAGRSVNCRFTPENRRQVIGSHVDSTRVLGEAIRRCAQPPRVWLNSSTATIYRHTFGPPHDESSTDFSATPEAKDAFSVEVALAWEKALREAVTPGTRQVALRTTLVFGTVEGGVFQILRRLARFGLGGRMGSGRQYVSWIHDQDFCRAVEWIVDQDDLIGPVNMAAPHPVTNAEMMRLFRQECGIPVGLPAAEWMLEVGAFFLRTETELLLKSRRVVPGKLLTSGFQFQFAQMKEALSDLQRRTKIQK
jgi:uncharacterized protein (TIGR01777 family)